MSKEPLWRLILEKLEDLTVDVEVEPGLDQPQQIKIEPGLLRKEVKAIEELHGFRFPPDLAEFLSLGLPKAPKFPDWCNPNDPRLRTQLQHPLESILWCVRHGMWDEGWGERPTDVNEASETVRRLAQEAPPLVPVFAHRYMPSAPHQAGLPVYSFTGGDNIIYGLTLEAYLDREFELGLGLFPGTERHLDEYTLERCEVPFWGSWLP